MQDEPTAPEEATTTDDDQQDGAPMTVLRWVSPGPGQVTVLSGVPLVLGRDPACATQLDSSRVSRRHAEVTPVAGVYIVRDLDSKNGVFVNAERTQKAPLWTGDVLRIGDFIAVVETVSAHGLSGFRYLGGGVHGGAPMAGVLEQARALAGKKNGPSSLLVGEPGTGKELVARAIQRFSGRTGPFVVFDATAWPESALDAELFGEGETKGSGGHLRAAHEGTLLLEQVAMLPPGTQERLLRVLERHEGLPGGKSELDVRLVATLQTPLGELPEGRLNAELRTRLEAAMIELPPLRERRAEIVPLFLELFARHARGTNAKPEPELLERLCLLDWPLNVRELDNVARRLLARHASAPKITLGHLTEIVGLPVSGQDPGSNPEHAAPPRRSTPSYPPDEIALLKEAIERHHGNLTKAASELRITRAKAYRMLENTTPEG